MKNLWILSKTEHYEDNYVIGIYSTLQKGKAAMKKECMANKALDLEKENVEEDEEDGFKRYIISDHMGSGGIELREIPIDQPVEIMI